MATPLPSPGQAPFAYLVLLESDPSIDRPSPALISGLSGLSGSAGSRRKRTEIRTCMCNPLDDAYQRFSTTHAFSLVQVHVVCGPFATLLACEEFARVWIEQGSAMALKRRAGLAQRLATQVGAVQCWVRNTAMTPTDERQVLADCGREDLVGLYDHLFDEQWTRHHVLPDFVASTLCELASGGIVKVNS